MKKYLLMITLSILTIFALAACGSSEEDGETTTTQ